MKYIVGDYMKLLSRYWVLRGKFNSMQKITTEIIEENRRLHEIIEDLKNGSVY